MNEKNMKVQEYIVNDYIALRLENRRTNIYVRGKLFNQCKRVVFNIPVNRVEELDEMIRNI